MIRRSSTSRLDKKSDELRDHRNAGVISTFGWRGTHERRQRTWPYKRPGARRWTNIHTKPSDGQRAPNNRKSNG